MKRGKLLLTSLLFVLAPAVPLFVSTSAQAATQSVLSCASQNLQIDAVEQEPPICDLTVDKQVSVNGGAFVEADTSADAANAHVGDTITWQITVANSGTATPCGVVFVSDILPAGFTLNNSAISPAIPFSTYDSGVWQLPLCNSDGHTNLPATLTLTSTIDQAGTYKNTAFFLRQDHPGSGCPDGGCPYVDANSTNDTNDAWVNIQTKPQVLAASTDSTLVNTGNQAVLSFVVGLIILAGLAFVSYGRIGRKHTHYKV